MEKIEKNELKNIRGGDLGTSLLIAGGVFLVGTFIVGVIDGITRPLKCNN